MNINTLIFLLLATFVASCGKPQYTASEHLQRAKTFSEKGEIKAAIIEYKNVLQLDPKNASTRINLAQLYLKIEDGSSSVKELNKAYEYGIDSRQYTDVLAKALLLQSKFDDIIKLQEPATETTSNKADFHIIKTEAYLALNKPEQAKTELAQAEKTDPGNTALITIKAKMAIYHSKYDLAKSYLAQAPQNNIPALFLTGKILSFEKKYDEATTYFQKVLALTEKNIPTRYVFESHISLSYLYIENNNFDNAIKHIESLEKINPKFFISKYLRANLAYKQKNYSEANDQLLELQKINPDFKPAYLLLGAVNYAMGYYNQTVMYLNKVISNEPNNVTAHKILGATQMKLGNSTDALTNFNKAYKLDPTDSKLLTLAGSAAIRNGNLGSGRTYLKQALGSGLPDEQIKASIATSYLLEGKYDKAITELEYIHTNELSSTNILLIKAYIKKADYASAIKTLREIAKNKPASTTINTLFGIIYFEKGDYPLATKYIQESIRLDSNNFTATYILAELSFHNKKYSEANKLLKKTLSINNEFLPALIKSAELASITKEHDKVVSFLNQAINVAPSLTSPRITLARYYLALGKASDAFNIIEALEKTNPSDPQVLSLLADTQMANNNLGGAINSYQKLLTINKSSPELFVKIARTYLQLKDYTHARKALDSALKIRKEYYPAIATLAFIEQHESNPSAALRLANKTIKQNPSMPNGYILKGDLLMQQKDYKTALKAYKNAGKYENSSLSVIRQYRALKKLGQTRNAESVLVSWLTNNPQDDQVRLILASFFQQNNDNNNAIKEYELILKKHPDNIVVLNNIALVYNKIKDSRAIDHARRAYTLNKESPEIADTYGWILVQNNEPKKGLTYLEYALSKKPDNRSIKFHLASTYVKLGNIGKAKQLLSDILSSNKPFQEQNDAKELFARL